MSVTAAQAEVLRARGYRAERTLLDGPRVVKDYEEGVYVTIVPGEGDRFHWSIWRSDDGGHLTGNWTVNAVLAADLAWDWIRDHWI